MHSCFLCTVKMLKCIYAEARPQPCGRSEGSVRVGWCQIMSGRLDVLFMWWCETLRGLPKPLWIVVLYWPHSVNSHCTLDMTYFLQGQVMACRGRAETVRNGAVQLDSRWRGNYNSFHWWCTSHGCFPWEQGNTAFLLFSQKWVCLIALTDALDKILVQFCCLTTLGHLFVEFH